MMMWPGRHPDSYKHLSTAADETCLAECSLLHFAFETNE